jgi:replicative DNA helicase
MDINSFLPPHDIDVEQAFLGSILLNNHVLDETADNLRPEYFYLPLHQVLFNCMLDMWAGRKPIDVILLLQEIKQERYQKKLADDTTIDQEVLLELTAKSTFASSPEELAKIIKDKYLLRTIVTTADEMKTQALSSPLPPDEILDISQQKLFQISMQSIDKTFVSIQEILGSTFERISDLHANPSELRGTATGFTDIDRILGGFHKSDLIIIAARPSMGKTAFALELTKRMALTTKTGVAFFSLEMSKDQLVDRMLSSASGIDLYKIRSGKFGGNNESQEFEKLGGAISTLSEAPIWIDDNGGLNILELRSKARRLKMKHNVGVIIIDYLQLMTSGNNRNNGNRVQEVSEISRGLKLLAKELNVPVIALSQLSRSVESRDDKRPMLSDLRESGSIEQDADVVMFVHREEVYHKETKKRGIADILISKHRNGQIGSVELAWIQHLTSFENLDGARLSRRVNE